MVNTEQEIRGYVAELRQLRVEWQRADHPFEIKVVCGDVFDADGFRRLEDAGVTDCITMPWYFTGKDTTPLENKIEGIHYYAEHYF